MQRFPCCQFIIFVGELQALLIAAGKSQYLLSSSESIIFPLAL
jgi:hypothetical protein